MRNHRVYGALCFVVLAVAWAPSALGLANRVFVSARSGNDANSCDNVNTPCKTFVGAVAELNPDGEVIVLDSGGYGSVTITQGVTIEAPAGVTAFIHPSSGDAITIDAGASDVVTLRGLVLNGGAGNGILVNTVGTLNVENCFITGFTMDGIEMFSAGRLNVRGTDVKGCSRGVLVSPFSGQTQVAVDHCHLDGNATGYEAATASSGGTTTTATYSTANGNTDGWQCGNATIGKDVLNLEFCTGSENSVDGLFSASTNAMTTARYSNCVFANNGTYGVEQAVSAVLQTAGNNTITGNGVAPTHGTIGTFPPM